MLNRSTLLCALSMLLLSACSEVNTASRALNITDDLTLHDQARNRDIPLHFYKPKSDAYCSAAKPCPVAIMSGGYGESLLNYSFVANALTQRGFLVVSVQHDLARDQPLPREGNLYDLRAPFWARSAQNLRFARDSLRSSYPRFDWDHPVLVGHSNGGDISLWFAREHPSEALAIITLDHRRVPLLRATRPKQLSLRGTDFPADPGVLPSPEEQRAFGIEVSIIPGAKHNDMTDLGPESVKLAIIERTLTFLDKLDISRMKPAP